MNSLLFYVTLAARISPSLHALSTRAHAPELESERLDVLAGSGRRPQVCRQLSVQHNRHSGGYIIHGGNKESAGPGYGVSATLRCLPKYLSVHS